MNRRARTVSALTSLALAAALAVAPVAARAADPVPPDRGELRAALATLPTADVTAGQVRVTGSAVRAVEERGGVRDLRSQRQVPADGRLRVASVTKAFTAVLVLRLAQDGLIDLQAPVQRYLPGVLPDSYAPVPVQSLLDHTSGLPSSTEDAGEEDPATFVARRFDYHSPREVLATAFSQPMMFAPGSAQRYTGTNYFVAGLLVEHVTGRSFAAELRRLVLRPLDLRDTYLPRPHEVGIRGPHVRTYVAVDGRPVDVTEQSPYGWAESGLVSTTSDLQHFLRAIFAGRLLDARSQRLLFTVPDVPYSGDGDCQSGPRAGRACFSVGLTRTDLPGGQVVWGKSGGLVGTASGVFGTRDGGRVLAYALHPTDNRHGVEGSLLQRIVAATFLPGQTE